MAMAQGMPGLEEGLGGLGAPFRASRGGAQLPVDLV